MKTLYIDLTWVVVCIACSILTYRMYRFFNGDYDRAIKAGLAVRRIVTLRMAARSARSALLTMVVFIALGVTALASPAARSAPTPSTWIFAGMFILLAALKTWWVMQDYYDRGWLERDIAADMRQQQVLKGLDVETEEGSKQG